MIKIIGDRYEVEELLNILKYLNYNKEGKENSSKDFMSATIEAVNEESLKENYNDKVKKVVMSFVLLRFNCTLDDVKYGPKTKELVKCRGYISTFLKKYGTFSTSSIGEIINKSRATVLYYIRKHDIDLENYKDIREEHVLLQKLIEQKL